MLRVPPIAAAKTDDELRTSIERGLFRCRLKQGLCGTIPPWLDVHDPADVGGAPPSCSGVGCPHKELVRVRRSDGPYTLDAGLRAVVLGEMCERFVVAVAGPPHPREPFPRRGSQSLPEIVAGIERAMTAGERAAWVVEARKFASAASCEERDALAAVTWARLMHITSDPPRAPDAFTPLCVGSATVPTTRPSPPVPPPPPATPRHAPLRPSRQASAHQDVWTRSVNAALLLVRRQHERQRALHDVRHMAPHCSAEGCRRRAANVACPNMCGATFCSVACGSTAYEAKAHCAAEDRTASGYVDPGIAYRYALKALRRERTGVADPHDVVRPFTRLPSTYQIREAERTR